jgi:hypothetical protein
VYSLVSYLTCPEVSTVLLSRLSRSYSRALLHRRGCLEALLPHDKVLSFMLSKPSTKASNQEYDFNGFLSAFDGSSTSLRLPIISPRAACLLSLSSLREHAHTGNYACTEYTCSWLYHCFGYTRLVKTRMGTRPWLRNDLELSCLFAKLP